MAKVLGVLCYTSEVVKVNARRGADRRAVVQAIGETEARLPAHRPRILHVGGRDLDSIRQRPVRVWQAGCHAFDRAGGRRSRDPVDALVVVDVAELDRVLRGVAELRQHGAVDAHAKVDRQLGRGLPRILAEE